jgi:hypothetical protein
MWLGWVKLNIGLASNILYNYLSYDGGWLLLLLLLLREE